MRLNLGGIVPALDGWVLCIDERSPECVITVRLPRWAKRFTDKERTYLALYLASKHLLDHRVAAAMHIYMVENKVALRPEVLVKALREAEVDARPPRAIEDHDNPYAWEAVLYKGILYAEQLLRARKKREKHRSISEQRRHD